MSFCQAEVSGIVQQKVVVKKKFCAVSFAFSAGPMLCCITQHNCQGFGMSEELRAWLVLSCNKGKTAHAELDEDPSIASLHAET